MKDLLRKLDGNRYITLKSHRLDIQINGLVFTNEATLETRFDYNALGQAADVAPLQVKTTEDTVFIFVDTNGDLSFGYEVTNGFYVTCMKKGFPVIWFN